jgi:hypothetical protein
MRGAQNTPVRSQDRVVQQREVLCPAPFPSPLSQERIASQDSDRLLASTFKSSLSVRSDIDLGEITARGSKLTWFICGISRDHSPDRATKLVIEYPTVISE